MSDRLHATDAAYLVAEEPRVPLHVGSIGVFEGAALLDEHGVLRLDELREQTVARLALLPRLRQRVANVPFDIARPVWVDDEHFDIANHIDAVELPAPGDERALLELAAELFRTPLDRARPLWHLRIVTGLPEGNVAMIQRAHHAMVDGVSGVDVSLVLLDATADVAPAAASAWAPHIAPTPAELLLTGIADRIAAPMTVAGRAIRSLRHPAALRRGVEDVISAVRSIGSDGVRAPRSSLNAQVGSRRRITVVRQRLDDVRRAGRSFDATVNDVVLAAVAGGVRNLLLSRGESVAGTQRVRALVPVSVRSGDESMALGNRVGVLLVSLPVGIADPIDRLVVTAATTQSLKASTQAASSDALLSIADVLPQSLARVIQRSIHHQPFVNLVVTNVPGPPIPLYALGARMLEAIPIVPLGGNMPLEVAILSYDGSLVISTTSDPDACPDVDVFTDGVAACFEAMSDRTRQAA